MAETVPDTKLEQKGVGYGVFAFLSPEAGLAVESLRNSIQSQLPQGLLWGTPADSLHTTLFEISMIYRDYEADKDAWFEEHKPHILSTLRNIMAKVAPIDLRFNEVEASQSAIIIKATDNGSFDAIREQVVSAGLSMPGSRTPPDIIHSSIFRYRSVVDLETVQAVVERQSIDTTMMVSEFFLERIGVVPIGDRTTVEQFKLLPTAQ